LSEPLEHAKATPAVAFCFLVNQLLGRERWARERLAAFAGQCAELRPPLLPPLRLTILQDGTVREGGERPEATLGLEGISGGALAEELRVLARHLRWDAEEEFSRVVGDVAAHRIAGAGRAFLGWQADSARRLSEALAAYATDEARLLIRRPQIKSLSEELARLEAGITAIEARIARLV
jgi:ubiquinone biosynthesis accessory factor UbiJ